MNISKLITSITQFSWASLLSGCGLLLLLNVPVSAKTTVDAVYLPFLQVIDAPVGPHDENCDLSPFVEAIEEVELSDESPEDDANFSKQLRPFALAVKMQAFTGFFAQHAPRGSIVQNLVPLAQRKLYLAYRQLKLDC